eukprot:c15536_g1_i1.p1 GENE.c15536_g1_i1~~c15536_g1_i1.p1  ORF type:complete len:442 (+),score=88.52 c15536_g1_i1:500-1825(+)
MTVLDSKRFVLSPNPFLVCVFWDSNRNQLKIEGYCDDLDLYRDTLAEIGRQLGLEHLDWNFCRSDLVSEDPAVLAHIKKCENMLLFDDPEWQTRLRSTIETNLETLFSIDGVVGVTGGYKTVRGLVDYAMPCVQVSVKTKLKDPACLVPAEINGIVTDVVEASFESLMTTDESWSQRSALETHGGQPTLMIGDMLCQTDKQDRRQYGTLGCFCQAINSSETFILSAAHALVGTGSVKHQVPQAEMYVIGNPRADRIFSLDQPVYADDFGVVLVPNRMSINSETIGTPYDWSLFNAEPKEFTGELNQTFAEKSLLDNQAQAVQVQTTNPELSLSVFELRPPLPVFKLGQATRLTTAKLSTLEFYIDPKLGHRSILVIPDPNFATEGDSGSIAFDENGNAVGMVVCRGRWTPNIYCIPIEFITRTLRVNLLGSMSPRRNPFAK